MLLNAAEYLAAGCLDFSSGGCKKGVC